jgi:hypothetical protein
MQFGMFYGAVSLAFSVAYGIAFLRRAPTTTRTAVKALSVAFLAFVVLIEDGPWLLAAALALCAIGDGFLARDGEADFQRGLAAFLAGHLVYIVLFLFAGGGLGLGWPAIAAQVGVIAAALIMARRLEPNLGALRLPVFAYVAVITLMTVLALGLPPVLWLAALGALLFMTSDAILAFERFAWPADAPQRAWSDRAVWALYYAAQALIVLSVLDRPHAPTAG